MHWKIELEDMKSLVAYKSVCFGYYSVDPSFSLKVPSVLLTGNACRFWCEVKTWFGGVRNHGEKYQPLLSPPHALCLYCCWPWFDVILLCWSQSFHNPQPPTMRMLFGLRVLAAISVPFSGERELSTAFPTPHWCGQGLQGFPHP